MLAVLIPAAAVHVAQLRSLTYEGDTDLHFVPPHLQCLDHKLHNLKFFPLPRSLQCLALSLSPMQLKWSWEGEGFIVKCRVNCQTVMYFYHFAVSSVKCKAF